MKDWSELSDQTRAMIAAALALVVILGWGLFYKAPPPSPSEPAQTITQSAATARCAARGSAD